MKLVAKPAPVFDARVSMDGARLVFVEHEQAQRAERLSNLAGQRVGVVLKPWKILRSERANAYYWGQVLTPMSVESSDGDQEPEEIHDAMCAMFLPNEHKRVEFFNKMTGEYLEVETDGRRSSKLHGEDFYQFVEKVRKFALEFMGVRTEDPDPEYWRKRARKTVAA